MKPSSPGRLNAQIYEEASAWFVEFRTGDVDDTQRRMFNAWLRTSPEHVRAYLELAAIWHEGSRLDPTHRFDADEHADYAPAAANVIALDQIAGAPPAREDSRSTPSIPGGQQDSARGVRGARFSIRLLAIAASVLLMILGFWAYSARNTYSTGVGEQRSLALEDGSTISLNTRSTVRIRFTADRRTIELLEGQALFRVAKDKTRPFIVQSGDTKVRAVGTEFDVNRKRDGTTVTVLEGRVAVKSAVPGKASGERPASIHAQVPRPAAGGPVPSAGEFLLAAGEQAVLTARTAVRTDQPNIAAVIAWTQRRLVFDSATLAQVVEEFNRYNQRLLVIQGPELADFHITGVFASTDPASLIRFLQTRPGIVVTEREDDILITRKLQ